MDRGMVSQERMEFLQQGNRRYILGTPKAILRRFEQESQDDWPQVHEGPLKSRYKDALAYLGKIPTDFLEGRYLCSILWVKGKKKASVFLRTIKRTILLPSSLRGGDRPIGCRLSLFLAIGHRLAVILTMRAYMRSSSSEHDPLDQGSTALTGMAVALIDL